ncbi:MAG: hypothetical protein ACREEQ_04560, partial [Caulobacteraceae bacterium]
MLLRTTLIAAAAAALFGGAAMADTHTHTDTAADAAVQQIVEGYTAAWKRADPQAIAANFTEDGDLINPDGFHAS